MFGVDTSVHVSHRLNPRDAVKSLGAGGLCGLSPPRVVTWEGDKSSYQDALVLCGEVEHEDDKERQDPISSGKQNKATTNEWVRGQRQTAHSPAGVSRRTRQSLAGEISTGRLGFAVESRMTRV